MAPPSSTDELLQQTRWLHRLARALVADHALADDLVHDTVVDALRQRPRGLRNLRSWLATVLRRRAARLLHRERARPGVERRAARAEALPAADDSVAQAMLHRDVVDEVLALGEPYRTAILLRCLRDLPLDEVARRTGAPVATVRSRVQRGLLQLRARLDRRHGTRAAWVAMLGPAPFATTVVATASLLMHGKTLASAFAAALALLGAWWWLLRPTSPPAPSPAAVAAAPDAARAAAPPAAEGADRARTDADATANGAPEPVGALATGLVLDEESKAPLAGVEVAWFVQIGDAAAPHAKAHTDATGRFELGSETAVAARHLAVLLRRADHAWTTHALGDPTATAPERFDLGTILLPPGTGIAGRVVDQRGAPVADAALLYYDTLFYTDGGRRVSLAHPLAIGTSAADGTFAPDARLVPVQDAMLLAAAPGGLGWLPLPGLTRSRTELRKLTVTLAPACELTICVHDTHGRPVAGAELIAEPQFTPLGGPSTVPSELPRVPALRALFAGATDAQGSVQLPHLPIGRSEGNLVLPATPDGTALGTYRLSVRAAGFVPASMRCELTAASHTETVVLAAPRTITITGRVADTGGQPLAGAAVATDAAVQTTTDGNGAFTLAAPSSNPLSVTASATGHRPSTERRELPADRDCVEIAFALTPAAPLTGVVVDEGGLPVAGARVTVDDQPSVPTDRQGRFTIPDLPVGRSLSLVVLPPTPSSDWAARLDLAVTTADSPITARLQRLEPGRCALTVELLDADGAPLEARIATLDRNGDLMHRAETTIGRVTAEHLGPGPWRLLVAPVRGPWLQAEFTIAGGEQEHRETVRQQRGAVLEVEVVPEPADLPLARELLVATGWGNPGRFDPPAGQLSDDRVLRLDPARAHTFRIVDIDPSRAFRVNAEAKGLTGELRFAPGTLPARARLVVQASGSVHFVSEAPWPQHGLVLFVRRPGGAFDEPNRCEGMEGRTELLTWMLAPGAWEWRIEALPTGTGKAPSAWEGRVEVPPGGTAEARVDAASRR